MNKQIKIYVLTTMNKERVEFMKQLLKDVNFEFVESLGTEALKELEAKYARKSLRYRKKALMLGEFGAFKTHAMAWERIAKSGEAGIIIEDSADFVRDASILLSDEVRNQINNCGLVSFTDYEFKLHPDRPTLFSDIPLRKAFPTRCYGITPRRANVLLSMLNKTGMVLPVDRWMGTPKLSGLFGFVSNIGVAIRRSNATSIANVRRGKASYNPLNLLFRAINKIKYQY
ncbi:glycosyltransferase family 25 protein [Vibrio alginolyticus]|nr:glycosyl transferase [Vibrio alginolyticus]EGQ9215335.1 glycosyl transferase [Vibrio alginolyticus]EIC9816418.1 glycosyltransferase family 25 protein [Vibrio alginolyticus]EIF2704611.1 glycosyltransferase family 25 protein [Vibrio alginolyticus]EJG0028448.1 glycosyltransferase family 25 protein [Vibrio alginolyticus]